MDKSEKMLTSIAWKEPKSVWNYLENSRSQENIEILFYVAVIILKVEHMFDQLYHGITKNDIKFLILGTNQHWSNSLAFINSMAHAKVPST